jgi:Ca-activated chloride channel family protein
MTPKSFGLAFGLTCVLTSTAFATPQSTVSAAIVFAVDRSTSVSSEEMSAQVKAHVSVLRSSEFVETAMAGDRCIGIHYMEWSGVGDVHPVLPWTIVCSRAKAEIAAAEIERRAGRPPVTPLRTRSSLAFAIDSARAALKAMPFQAHRKIISISTDGTSNDGVSPVEARDRASKENYIINAISLAEAEPGMEDDLKAYLRRHVITGEGSFALAARDLDDYTRLILQKTLLEVRGQERRRVNYPPH